MQKNGTPTIQNNFGNNTVLPTAPNGNEDVIFIPLALQDSNQVHGALSCKVNGDSVSIRLIDGSNYNWYTANPDSLGMNGEQVTLLLMKLDKVAFGHSLFKVNDSSAFGISVNSRTKYVKMTDSIPNGNSIAPTAGHWEYYNTTLSYITYEPDLCGCAPNIEPCPDGGMHPVYHSETLSGSIWIEDEPWYNPNGGGTGGGGGGTGGGGPNNELPIEPDPGTQDFGLAQFIIEDFNSTGVTNPCVNSVINEIGQTGCQSYLLKLYQQFFSSPKIDKYKFTFVENNSLVGNSGNPVASHTNINALANGVKEAVITINPTFLQNASKEFIATVLIHEITHAFISFQNPNSTETQQHTSMFYNDVDKIADAVRELYPSLSIQNSRAMALQGMDEILFDFTTTPVSVYNDKNQTALNQYLMNIADSRNLSLPFFNGTAGTPC